MGRSSQEAYQEVIVSKLSPVAVGTKQILGFSFCVRLMRYRVMTLSRPPPKIKILRLTSEGADVSDSFYGREVEDLRLRWLSIE